MDLYPHEIAYQRVRDAAPELLAAAIAALGELEPLKHDDGAWAAMTQLHHAISKASDSQLNSIMAREVTDNGWQPIETAPRDGTVVLFATPEAGDWRYHMSRADDRQGGAFWLENATHWMPLPPAPAISTTKHTQGEG